MNKKVLLVSILAVFMLLTITFASAVNTSIPVKKKESPLFSIRTRRAINEKIGDIVENIKTKYIGERVFLLPFQLLLSPRNTLYTEFTCIGYKGCTMASIGPYCMPCS